MYMEPLSTRTISDHMIYSHIWMILPCIWWMVSSTTITSNTVIFDRVMTVVLSISIIMSVIYHMYYEQILQNSETIFNVFGVIVLNIYMFYKNVPFAYILSGLGIVTLLLISLHCSHEDDVEDHYQTNHPYCHYIAGTYIFYCVYHIIHSNK